MHDKNENTEHQLLYRQPQPSDPTDAHQTVIDQAYCKESSYMTPFERDQAHQARGTPGQLCYPCSSTLKKTRNFSTIGTPAWVNYGYEGYEDVAEPITYCCCCRYILRARELAKRGGVVEEVQSCEMPDSFHYDLDESNLFVHDDGTNLEDNQTLLNEFGVKADSRIRTVKRHWADLEMVKSWLTECEKEHGNSCNNHRGLETEPESLLLLDVEEDRLVTGNFNDRYFALSYVWGTSNQFLTLIENYDELCKPGSVSTQPLTQTIRDAMSLVRSLDERYLWIDTMVSISCSNTHQPSAASWS